MTMSAHLLDSEVLASLRSLNQPGEPDFLNQLIDTYLSLSPNVLNDLETALKTKNASNFAELAHLLKGMSLGLGAQKVAVRCEELEKFGRDNDLSDSVTLVKSLQSLRSEWAETAAALKNDWRIAPS